MIGVGAGIAAYKVAYLVRSFRAAGWATLVVPTPHSLEFVGKQTWEELSENPVATDIFYAPEGMGHIELARRADLIVVAPCTADLLSQLRVGSAGNLLTAAILASDAPQLLVPAMHTHMWSNPATVDNVAVLRSRGVTVMDPATGALSSGDSGPGRMPEPDRIFDAAQALIHPRLDLVGKRILITAGGTIEAIDPVRYLGNHSSGRQGVELAQVAARAGAVVTLIVGKTTVDLPHGNPRITLVQTPSAADMQKAVQDRISEADVLIMAAAVADYRPKIEAAGKLKKDVWGDNPVIELEKNPDILRGVTESAHRPPVVVGFAAETGTPQEIRELGARKARAKKADFLAVNQVGNGVGFGEVQNSLSVLDANGEEIAALTGTKQQLASELLALVVGGQR